MAQFTVQVDVTMGGYLDIDAQNEEEAKKKVHEIDFVSSDLRLFHWIGTEIIDYWEAEGDE